MAGIGREWGQAKSFSSLQSSQEEPGLDPRLSGQGGVLISPASQTSGLSDLDTTTEYVQFDITVK
jgi:hypothetical protein